MAESNGVAHKIVDEDALHKSVQVMPDIPVPNHVAQFHVFHIAGGAADTFSPWGQAIKLRDQQLREFIPTEPLFASALATVVSRNSAFSWKLEGPEAEVKKYQQILQAANFGRGWVDLITRVSTDLYTQDSGAFIEIIRAGKSETSELIGLAHLDAARCFLTGIPEQPVIYQDAKGQFHLMNWWQVVQLTEMPATYEGIPGLQYCALTRLLRAAQTLRDIGVYIHEKVAGQNTRAIALLKGVTTKEVQTAFTTGSLLDANKGFQRFSMPVMVNSVDPKADVDFKIMELASLPDGFDLDLTNKQYILQIAMAFLSDYQDFAPLPGGNLGTSSQSEILHLKTRGKGPGLFMKILEQALNWNVLPESVTFSFDEQDEAADKAVAEVKKMRADERAARLTSQEITPKVAQMLAFEAGDLTQEQFDLLEKQAEEQAKKEEEQQGQELELRKEEIDAKRGQPQAQVDDQDRNTTTPAGKGSEEAVMQQEEKTVPASRLAIEDDVAKDIASTFDELHQAMLDAIGIKGQQIQNQLDEELAAEKAIALKHPGHSPQSVHAGGRGAAGATQGGDAKAIVKQAAGGGAPVKINAGQLADVLNEAETFGPPPLDLQNIQVEGAGNGYAFAKHLRDIPRSGMPQLPETAEGMQKLKDHFSSKGFSIRVEEVDPRQLIATQNEIDSSKVAKIFKSIQKEGGLRQDGGTLIVSEEYGVVDGHHRFAATTAFAILNPGTKVRVLKVSADIDDVLKASHEFADAAGIPRAGFGEAMTGAGARAAGLAEKADPGDPPDASKPYMYVDGEWHLIALDLDDEEHYAKKHATHDQTSHGRRKPAVGSSESVASSKPAGGGSSDAGFRDTAGKPIYAEAADWMEKGGVHTWAKKVTETERKALVSYSDEDVYGTVNGDLRKQAYPTEFHKTVIGLDKAIDKFSLKEPTILYRGIGPTFAKTLAVGKTFKDDGYTSTSLLDQTAKDFAKGGGMTMRIKAPAGTKAAPLFHQPPKKTDYPAEFEILLKRGSKFKVVGIKDGVVDVELV